jgi:hypothetical protein
LSERYDAVGKNTEGAVHPITVDVPEKHSLSREDPLEKLRLFGRKFRETWVLVRRNTRVFFADSGGFLLAFAQIPVIALLMYIAFYKLYDDHRNDDDLYRKHYCFIQELNDAESDGKGGHKPFSKSITGASLNMVFGEHEDEDEAFEKYYKKVYIKQGMSREEARSYIDEFKSKYKDVFDKISLPSANSRAVVIFSLILSSIWLGIMGSCIEVVKEQAILSREKRTCIGVSSYLFSKVLLKTVVVGLQVLFLALLIVPRFLEYGIARFGGMFIVLWLTGVASSLLGLLISALSGSQRMALMAVPMLLIPQILFGGVLRPGGLVHGTNLPQTLGMATIQRWAFDAAISCDPFANKGILSQYEERNVEDKYFRWEARIVGIKEQGLKTIYFGNDVFGFYNSLLVLGLCGFAMLASAYLILKRRE